jgi:hypothetical protein
MGFWKDKNKDITKEKKKDYSNNLGREITTVDKAKELLYFEPNIIDPRQYINIEKGTFYGLIHDKDKITPIYIDENAINHELFCGITRSGKGIMAGCRTYETLQHKKRGLVYIDVKKEKYTPQILLETLKEQNRIKDLEIVNFPNDFGYSGFNKDDSITEVWEKICIALSIEPVDDVKSEHYRRVERQTLLKLLKIAWLEYKYFSLDWNEILSFVEALTDDLKKRKIKTSTSLKS